MLKTYHITDIPYGSQIGIYGTGKLGLTAKDIVESSRQDIKIVFFINSFKRGAIETYDIIKPEDLHMRHNEINAILICSAYFVDIFMHLNDLQIPISKISLFSKGNDFFPKTVLVSDKHRFIFIPIGKVASTSFQKAFAPYCPDGLKNIDFRQDSYKNYYKFSFTRNPFDRLVSCFSFIYSETLFKQFFIHLVGKDKFSFHDFLKAVTSMKDGASHDLWASQSLFLCDSKNKLLVDRVYKLEDLQKSLPDLEQRLGIKLQVPHLNASEHHIYQTYFSQNEIDLFSQHYSRDLRNFSYDF